MLKARSALQPTSAAASSVDDRLLRLTQINRRRAAQGLASGLDVVIVAETEGEDEDFIFWALDHSRPFRTLVAHYEKLGRLSPEERMTYRTNLAWEMLERRLEEGDEAVACTVLREARLQAREMLNEARLEIKKQEVALKERQEERKVAEAARALEAAKAGETAKAGEAAKAADAAGSAGKTADAKPASRTKRGKAASDKEKAGEGGPVEAPQIPDPPANPDGVVVPWDEEELQRLSHLPPAGGKPQSAEESYALWLSTLPLERRMWRKAIRDPRAWDGLTFLPQAAIEEQYREQGDCSAFMTPDELAIARQADDELAAWDAISREIAREAMGIFADKAGEDPGSAPAAVPEAALAPVPAPTREPANDDRPHASSAAEG